MEFNKVLLLVTAFCVSSCLGWNLIAVPNASQDDVKGWIAAGVDIRGIYGTNPTFALLISSSVDLILSYSIVIGTYDAARQQVIIIEDANLSVQAFPAYPFVDNHECFGDTCVIIFKHTNESKLHDVIPPTAELAVLPPSRVSPPANVTTIPTTSSGAPIPIIQTLVGLVNSRELNLTLDKLTAIHTRQAQSSGAVVAQQLIADIFSGYGLLVSTFAFRAGYSSNVLGEFRGETSPNKIVIIGAHYDCRSETLSSTTNRAPGANDDGSGVAILVEIARILSSSRSTINIPYTIRLIAFSGEEQGLYGSTAYADFARSNGLDIVAMLQGDMLGYQSGAAPRLEFATRYATLSLNTQLTTIASEYVPGLAIGTTTSCCSDQQPFYNNGYPAVAYNEGGGYTIDPQYHTTGDVHNRRGYSVQQINVIARSILAGAAVLAGISAR